MNKDLRKLSLQISEDEYRKDEAYSYSTLARFAREGFDGLPHLYDKIESPSLTFGSCVDSLITGNEGEFDSKFLVAEMQNEPSDAEKQIAERLYSRYGDKYKCFKDIPEDCILSCLEDMQWNNHWLPKTRVKKLQEDCPGYYALLFEAEGRKIISTKLYNKAMDCVDALKSSIATRFYFEEDNAFDTNIQRFYQLKFKAKMEGLDFKCMPDELIVVHDKKIIVPVDLKTSSKAEWEFHKSFLQWKYYLQASLYTRILKENLCKDEYFKDFQIASYKFIVVNKASMKPLVWAYADRVNNANIKLEDPIALALELDRYLKEKPSVPFNISLSKPNSIDDILNQL